jgi:hypothetical protein
MADIGEQAVQRISGHCGEAAHRIYQLVMDLHEHELDVLQSAVHPRKAKSEVLSTLSGNIASIGEYYPESKERAAVITELSTIKDQLGSLRTSDYLRIVTEAAEGYERLVHGVLLPVMLDEFAECECETRRGHEPADSYMPAVDEVRTRLTILREFQQPRRQRGHR